MPAEVMANLDNTLQRFKQTTNHVIGNLSTERLDLSIIHGAIEPPLVDLTVGGLLDQQCELRGWKECIVLPWTGTRWTYAHLRHQSKRLAKTLLQLGVHHGDRISILAGNCEEYVALFFAAGYIGSILVVLNTTYTAVEAQNALLHSGCSISLGIVLSC
jgi:non-ribosomal peptide synthetase component F